DCLGFHKQFVPRHMRSAQRPAYGDVPTVCSKVLYNAKQIVYSLFQSESRYSRRVVPERRPRSISNEAADNLTFIRSAMERSSAFTAIPGVGGVVIGAIGLVAAVVGARQPTPDRWLGTWLVAAFVALI